MAMSRSERQKRGLVGKKILTDVVTGEKTLIDFESENIGVLTNEEVKRLGWGINKPRGKNFTDVYDGNGKVIAYDEIIEKDDD